jgi:DNA-binding GntR family transcriptional regulator
VSNPRVTPVFRPRFAVRMASENSTTIGRIAADLRQAIRSGEYRPGHRPTLTRPIPSHREIIT